MDTSRSAPGSAPGRTHISVCPRCQSARGDERFCWFCHEDFERHDGLCTECGQPKDLMANIEKYVRAELE